MVSFVLAAYKRKYLDEAIRSILTQTVADFELVVVDDASPENLDEVVGTFKDPRIRYVKSQKNRGGTSLVDAWNYALSYAQNEWCVLASDDDVYASDYLEKMLALAEKYPNVNICHCRLAIIDKKGCITKIAEKRPEFENALDLAYARGIKRCLQVAPEFMFRKTVLLEKGGFVDFPLAWYSDDATWLVLAKEHGVAYAEELLFYWRYSDVNISANADLVEKKVAAAEQYRKWIVDYLDSVEAWKDEDRYLKSLCQNIMPGVIDQQTVFDLVDTSWKLFVPMICRVSTSRRNKLGAVRNKLLRLCHL